jgi:ankyrin repeat protein
VRLLLAAGAHPDARTAEGATPAELARKSGHAAIADALDGAAAVGRTS